jgi:hypothetical protein
VSREPSRIKGDFINNDVMQLIVVIAASLGGLSIVSAIARRIAGPYSRRALATRIGLGRLDRSDDPALDDLRDEVAQLRSEVAELRGRAAELDEVQNRLDFTERLLAQRDRGALPDGKS